MLSNTLQVLLVYCPFRNPYLPCDYRSPAVSRDTGCYTTLLGQVVKDIRTATLSTVLVLQKTLLVTLFQIDYTMAPKGS
jgi:hypothetical protein